jgi:hypothetical protein
VHHEEFDNVAIKFAAFEAGREIAGLMKLLAFQLEPDESGRNGSLKWLK